MARLTKHSLMIWLRQPLLVLTLATAYASDFDASDSISYSLSNDAGGLFDIDSSTGIVTLADELDYENAPIHHITVTANSTDGSAATKNFEINVLNEYEVSEIINSHGFGYKTYLNGQLYNSEPMPQIWGDIRQNDFDLIVGGQLGYETERRWEGSLDELRIWDIARTHTEIAEAYNIELTGNEEGLVYYLNFEEQEPYTDSASQLGATPYGAPIISDGAPIDGINSNGLFLDGSSHLQVADNGDSPLDISGAITLEAWVKPDQFSSFSTIFGKVYSHPSENWAYGLYEFGGANLIAPALFTTDMNLPGAWTEWSDIQSDAGIPSDVLLDEIEI